MLNFSSKLAKEVTENIEQYTVALVSVTDRIKFLSGHKQKKDGKWYIPKNAVAKITSAELMTSGKGSARIPDFPLQYAAARAGIVNGLSVHPEFAGFTLSGILAMDADEVKAHKLSLKGAKVKAFSDAKIKAAARLSAAMANLRRSLDTVQGIVKPQKDGKGKTAKGKKAAGKKANDNQSESGSHTEADSQLPPAIVDPALIELLNKAAQLNRVDQATLAFLMLKSFSVLQADIESRKGKKKAK